MKSARYTKAFIAGVVGIVSCFAPVLAQLAPVGSVDPGGSGVYSRLFVNGNRVYASEDVESGNNVYQINASNKSAPVVTTTFQNREFGVGKQTIEIVDDMVYQSAPATSDILIIDMLSTPPQIVGRQPSSRNRWLDFDQGYLHVGMANPTAGNMVIYDVLDPAHIVMLPLNHEAVLGPGSVFGDHAYLSKYPGGLGVANLTDRSNWFLEAVYTEDPFQDWWITTFLDEQNGYLFRIAQNYGFQIFNTQNRSNIYLEGSAEITNNARTISVEGAFAFIAAGSDGLLVYDISNVNNPVLRTIHPCDARDVVAEGDYVYLLNGATRRVEILRVAGANLHTIRIVNRDWLTVDKFEYKDGNSWVVINANHPSIRYNGDTWGRGRCDVSRAAWEDDGVVGATSVEFTFTGTGIRWFAARQQYQSADVYLDGVFQTRAVPSEDKCNFKAFEKVGL